MVGTTTFNKLTADELNEYKKHSSTFIKAVLKSDARNGFDFEEKYSVQNKGNDWFLSKTINGEPFAGIVVTSKNVINTLLTDAAQNYGR